MGHIKICMKIYIVTYVYSFKYTSWGIYECFPIVKPLDTFVYTATLVAF